MTVHRIACSAGDSAARQFMSELNGPGSGSLRQPAHLATLDLGDTVTVSLSGLAFAWTVEKVETGLIGEPGSLWASASGRGPMALLENAIVRPDASGGSERRFDFTNPAVGDWVSAAHGTMTTYPGCSWWLPLSNGADPGAVGSPVEPAAVTALWLRVDAGPVGVGGRYRHWMRYTGIRACEVYVNGQSVARSEDGSEVAWDAAYEAGDPFVIAALLRADPDDAPAHPVLVINYAEVFDGTPDPGLIAVGIDPREEWRWTRSSLTAGGWSAAVAEPVVTVADLWAMLEAEAIAAGDGPLPTVTVTSTMEVTGTWRVGTTLYQVVQDWIDQGLCVVTQSDGTLLFCDTPTGAGVALSGSTNVESLSQSDEAGRATRALVRYREGYTTVGAGTRTTYIEYGDVDTEAEAQARATAALADLGPRTTIQSGACAAVGTIPTPGGTITWPGGSGTCISVSVTEDDAGVARWTPEVES